MTASPPIGHNGGPSLYLREIGKLQAIDAVLKNTTFSQTEALVLIGLIVRSDDKFANAFPGAATLAVYAKVKKTDQVFKALRQLEDHFRVISRESRGQGRSNTYSVMPQRVVDAIVAEFTARKLAKEETHPTPGGEPATIPTPPQGVGLHPTHPLAGGDSNPPPHEGHPLPGGATHPSAGGATHPLPGGAYPFLIHPSIQSGEDARERASPPASHHQFVPVVDWRTALNPQSAVDSDDVFWVDGVRIEVINGFRAELEKDFPNVDIASGLAVVAGEARPEERGTELKRRIRRKFGYLQNDERNKDRRYGQRATVASSQSANKTFRR